MSATNDDRIKRERAQNIAWRRDLGIGTAFAERLAEDPQAAMEEANTQLAEASRQEENRQNILEGSL